MLGEVSCATSRKSPVLVSVHASARNDLKLAGLNEIGRDYIGLSKKNIDKDMTDPMAKIPLLNMLSETSLGWWDTFSYYFDDPSNANKKWTCQGKRKQVQA